MGLSCSDLCGKCSEDGCSNTLSVEEDVTNTYLTEIPEINNNNNNTPCYDDMEEPISECVYESMLMTDSWNCVASIIINNWETRVICPVQIKFFWDIYFSPFLKIFAFMNFKFFSFLIETY